VYNKAVFEEAGITKLPKSSEEFLEACAKLKKKLMPSHIILMLIVAWTLDQWEDHAYGTLYWECEL